MKEIKLNHCNYLRGGIKKAEVDETKLEFRNGFAVATAQIWTEDHSEDYTSPFRYEPIFYECDGLINEQFQELYSVCEHGDTRAIRNLMFLRHNRSISRIGDNNFIVETVCPYDSSDFYKEYRHVRITDEGPTIIQRKVGGPCQMTTNENLVIIRNKALYDINSAMYITPMLCNIKESEVYDGIFDVMVDVTSEALKTPEGSCELKDYLCFKINSEVKVISDVLSSLDGYIKYAYVSSVYELLAERKKELTSRAQEFIDLMHFSQRNDGGLQKAGYVKKR